MQYKKVQISSFQPPGGPERPSGRFPSDRLRPSGSLGAWNASRDHSPGDLIIQGVVPGRSTRTFLTNKAVQSLRIKQGPTVTLMWNAKSQAKPQTYSDSQCFIIKPQRTWRYWHCLTPVSTMRGWSSQKRIQLCRGAQTRLLWSYVCQNARLIPEGLFGQQIVRKSTKGWRLVREIWL